MSASVGPEIDRRPAELRDIANRIEPAFPDFAAELREMAAELVAQREDLDYLSGLRQSARRIESIFPEAADELSKMAALMEGVLRCAR